MGIVPEVALNSGHQMPLVGFGTAVYPLPEVDAEKQLIAPILCAIRNGYRHFDTASLYQTEQALGGAIKEALRLGLIKSRTQLFITSKLWCSDSHQHLVLPALKKTLQNLQLEYLDLYLVHMPLSSRPGKMEFPIPKEDFLPMDYGSVWAAMEECQGLGLTKSIGVSNFSCRKLEQLLATAKITPAVNEVEMNPVCQQKQLREFCKAKSIVVTACAPLGAGSNAVMGNDVLKEIAKAKGKTCAQVTLRWLYEQGVGLVPKSFNDGRMKENLDIFDWTLSEEESKQISQLPQGRVGTGDWLLSDEGPFKSLEELWDGEI